jgi:hypothetical protein
MKIHIRILSYKNNKIKTCFGRNRGKSMGFAGNGISL